MNLAPFQIEGVKRFRIVLCRVILLLLILRCFFVILCLREEALLQIGVIEEWWWVTWYRCNLRVDGPREGEQPEVWVRIIISKRWAIWALTAAAALGTLATACLNLCIFKALIFPDNGRLILHPFDYLIFALFVSLARHLGQLLFKMILRVSLPEPVGEVTPWCGIVGSTVLFHESNLSWRWRCLWLLLY